MKTTIVTFKQRMRTLIGRKVKVVSHASPIFRGRIGKIADHHGWNFLIEFNDNRPGLNVDECWVNLKGLRSA